MSDSDKFEFDISDILNPLCNAVVMGRICFPVSLISVFLIYTYLQSAFESPANLEF